MLHRFDGEGGELAMSDSRLREIPRRSFGRYSDQISIIGLGGYHLGKAKTRGRGRPHRSRSDRCRHQLSRQRLGVSRRRERRARMGRAIDDRRESVFLMTKVCTHGRDATVAMRQLEESLRRLRTDHLDLWQIHECVYDNDPERHFARGGVVEALDKAKRQGKVRYVGFTGHKDPEIHLRMLAHEFPFDACQLPLNGFDAGFRSFQHQVLPELARQRIAPIGMKSLGGDGRVVDEARRARRRRASLRDEPAGVHDGLRHRFAQGAPTEPEDRARVRADERTREARLRASSPREGAMTGVSSCTRPVPSTRARKAAGSTASPARRTLRCEVR